MKNKIKIVAHRGYSAKYPENTLSAFKAALKAGANVIECDLHLTKDNQIVIHHDYYVNLTRGRLELINNLKLSELKSHFSSIVTLEQLIKEFGNKIEFELELKTPKPEFVDKVLRFLTGIGVIDDVEFTSPHIPLIIYLKSRYPHCKTGLFLQPYSPWMTPELGRCMVSSYMELTSANVAHLPPEIVDQKLVQLLKTQGNLIHVSNCDSSNVLKQIRKIKGVDFISTGNPLMAKKYFNKK